MPLANIWKDNDMFLNLDRQNKNACAAMDNDGGKLSYGELVDAVNNFSQIFEPRTVVFCFCQNSIDMLIGYLGFIEGGVVPVLLSKGLDVNFARELYHLYRPRYIFAPQKILDKNINQIYALGQYALYKTENEIYPLNGDLALLMSTSGSTGSPKFVRYTRKNLEANAKNVALAFEWTGKERALIDLHMEYTMGLNVINTHLYVGATLLMTTDNIMSSDYWDYIKDNKATNLTGVPFTYELMLKLRFYRMDLPHLTTFAQGGGKLSDADFEKLASYADETGKRFIPTFGTTETAARMSMLPSEMALEKTGSIGKAIPEGKLFLIDENGNSIDTPELEGELCYRGPNVTMGYAEKAEDLIKGDEFCGEYHTGDLAKRDYEGYFYITGRKGRFLKLTGHRVSLDQCQVLVESVFDTECACIGTDHKMLVYVTCKGKSEEIKKLLCQKTGLFSSLFSVYEIEEIPRNETGKIQFQRLNISVFE